MKKKSVFMISGLIVCVCLLAGAIYLFSRIFPKAEPIGYPDVQDIVSVALGSGKQEV
ncbi:hypothetical protein [Sporotomaculum syntrophicum]|uniref:hypothetical protein n=1 Tax=Sporotomaculum syntrophicum TaxID=182264 RepID=UPI00137B906F|nr:hypothetical protein [Sporotomaculum syntrophicum]